MKKSIFAYLVFMFLIPGLNLQAATTTKSGEFLGTYYTGKTFNKLVLTRVDPQINFDWGYNSFASGQPVDSFSVRWEGFITPSVNATYKFQTVTDDGVRLWVNGKLIIDHFANQAAKTYTASVDLTGGSNYTIKMEYFENTGRAAAKLTWTSTPITSTPPPPPPVTTEPKAGEFSGTYYTGVNFDKQVLTRIDPAINFNWGSGSFAAGQLKDSFSARWTGYFVPAATGSYKFHTETDDGLRLWVNGSLVIDHWIKQAKTAYDVTVSLTQGQNCPVIMEYYENSGNASALLTWTAPTVATPPPASAPVINSVTYTDTITSPKNGVTVTVNASDANGSTLQYAFTGPGTITPTTNPNSVIWIPSYDNGTYVLEAKVSNASFTASKMISVQVKAGFPLDLTGAPIGSKMTCDTSLDLTGATGASLILNASGIDTISEAKMSINGTVVALPAGIAGLNAGALSASTDVALNLLKSGSNSISFEYAGSVSGGTPGFKIDSLSFTMKYPAVTEPVKAFPGADGFGAATKGGRGGKVLFVTNLSDSGTGSLRAACTATGARIVVFKTGGLIQLNNDIKITSPYITIAAQTAPGGGICLANGGLSIETSEVIVRGLRIRPGDSTSVATPVDRHAININAYRGAQSNIIIDHCSLSWGVDENIGSWSPQKNITIQWSIISEGLYNSLQSESGPHSMGILIEHHVTDVSILHNLFAHNMDRNPLIESDCVAEVMNNVIYNWKWQNSAAKTGGGVDTKNPGPTMVDMVSNYFKMGPNSDVTNYPINLASDMQAQSKVYALGNESFNRNVTGMDAWSLVSGDPKWRSNSRVADSKKVTQIQTPADAYTNVIKSAGAIIPARDSVDTRVVNSVINGTGALIDSQSDVGGWPSYSSGTTLQDTDSDGIPDAWEIQKGLNASNSSDAALLAPSGYPWIEEYINSLIPALK